jgi:hypothetical protein
MSFEVAEIMRNNIEAGLAERSKPYGDRLSSRQGGSRYAVHASLLCLTAVIRREKAGEERGEGFGDTFEVWTSDASWELS